MKSRIDHPVGLVFLLIALFGSLFGQAPVLSHADRALPAYTLVYSSAQHEVPSAIKPHESDYVIGNDDILAINVWKEPDLCRSIPVRSDGKISLPLVGEILAAGRTPLQLEQDIAIKLKNYLTIPEVTVMVEKINSENFNIVGQVTKPGSYALSLAPTVMDAIATAGGFRDCARQKSIYILRQTSGGGKSRIAFNYKGYIKGKNSCQNVRLHPHDTIVVP